MKIRLAKKIMKQREYFNESTPAEHIKRYSIYWLDRLGDYPKASEDSYYKADHRITKAISLTSKKKKYEQKEEVSK